MRIELLLAVLLLTFSLPTFAFSEKKVLVEENQLSVDGAKQPQLFGAEVQYFRLRGGYGPNVPRKKVVELWNRALDKAVEARMNAVSFYIPWDFHEYAEGKFDFTGTVDEDGDGNPDYPSRDVLTFLRLVKEHGIRHILVRPGPYINAEWGFLGFGAIPEWFHDKYPNSHMQNSAGLRTKLYDYHNPDFLAKTKAWFTAVYNQVLKDNLGPGKPIDFLQLDNETNYLWQSIYGHDYGPAATAAYQAFLKRRYGGDLAALNLAHHRSWADWRDFLPPKEHGRNLGEDQDWYRYHDESIHAYLGKVRRMWEELGVREPGVIFTLAESYNAAENGLLPNYLFRNDRGHTGLMTVNLYPKTFGQAVQPLFNQPFKADLDVKAATVANSAYWGSHQEWAMGPEIQGGWWRGIDVSSKARQQTYLTVIGHGLKAFFVYYFNEGDNFGVHWAHDQAERLYTSLRHARNVPDSSPMKDLPADFWDDLQSHMDRELTVGFNSSFLLQGEDPFEAEKLYFDAPLDRDANPRGHYFDLQRIGARVVSPYADFLARSLEAQDDVAFVKDTESHVPGGDGINNVWAASDWSSGLLGYLLNAGWNPHLVIGEISPDADFAHKLLVHIDTGVNAQRTRQLLGSAFLSGRTVVNFLSSQIAQSLGYQPGKIALRKKSRAGDAMTLTFYLDTNGQLVSGPAPGAHALQIMATPYPIFTYDKDGIANAHCESILFTQEQRSVGYRCRNKEGGTFVQIGALLFADYGNGDYSNISDGKNRKIFLRALAQGSGAESGLELSPEAEQTVAFARNDPEKKLLWITVKTGSRKSQSLRLRVAPTLLALPNGTQVSIKGLLGGKPEMILDAASLGKEGFPLTLDAYDSDVYVVQAVQ